MNLKKVSECCFEVPIGTISGMKVPGKVFVNDQLHQVLMEEYERSKSLGSTSFIPALVQICNVATLPGIVGHSVALPDVHSGYGFAIGNVAAFDVSLPEAVVSPGGVGFDINCGVRLIRTNLMRDDVIDKQEMLAQKIFEKIPVGVGASSTHPIDTHQMSDILERGMKWASEEGISWEQDLVFTENEGCLPVVKWSDVSSRAIKRGINQLGTLGAGNHYVEVQWVEEIYDEKAAAAMGVHSIGQICIMIHCGSRGLGHQVATDYVEQMDQLLREQSITLVDRQLTCSPIDSAIGRQYLSAMAASANFAFVNRSKITQLLREAFHEVFSLSPEDMDMNVVYDVAHNVAKLEEHYVDGSHKQLLVHRKGSTRAFPPGHPEIPSHYQSVGQPVLVGGSMGTCSFVLVGTEEAMKSTFGSTCHGAGRAQSRHSCRKMLSPEAVLEKLKEDGISIRVASPSLVSEEAPDSYKDVEQVVDSCVNAGISKKVFKLKPFCVIKG